jgi:tetratricopeptide (TPR) repeat protein
MKKPLTLSLLMMLVLSLAAPLQAEDKYLLSEKTYKSLSKAQELMDADKYSEAGKRLQDLLAATDSGSYDRAVVQQTIGYLYSAQDQYDKAASAFQQALDSNALPEDVTHNLRFNLAQILIADGQYKKGIALMEKWLQSESKPQNSVYVLLATAYYRVDNYSKVVENIRQAISNDADPKEDWYRLQLAAHMALKQYKSAIAVLEKLITRYPHRKVYWDQLSALYLQEGKEFSSLAVRMLADRLDLGDPDTVINLADMYLYLRIPYKSGRLLQKAMDDGVIAANFKHMQKLADSWLASREDDKAAATLTKMLTMDSSGETHLKLGRVYVGMEQWQQAETVLQQAAEKLKGEDQGKVQLLLGTSLFNLDKLKAARAAFSRALSYDSQEKRASQWLRHIDDMLEKQKKDEETA